MQRDVRRLANTRFDMLVVGAGIYGAAIAWEAAQRGLSVALIDRGDFGSGASFNSLKTIHGGLRSLQRGSLVEMREFIRERRALFRIAPHLVQPLQFVIPTSRSPKRSRTAMRIALAINDLVARDRNVDVDPALHLPRGRLLGLDDTRRLFPGVDEGATGGASWYDGQMYNADRLVLGFVQSAVGAGAAAANYVRATGFLHAQGRVAGATAVDVLSGDALDVRAAVTINAGGAWAAGLTNAGVPASAPIRVRLSRAVNLVTSLPAPACALGNTVDGRFLFCVPWRGVAIFGTLHSPYQGTPDDLRVTEREASAFLDDLNRAFPGARARIPDVTLVHQGLLPTDGVSNGDVQLSKRSLVRDHREDGAPGLMTVVGVRYTTARHTARQAVEAASAGLGRTLPASRSAVTPLAGGDVGDLSAFIRDAEQAIGPAVASARVSRGLEPDDGHLPPASAARLARSYGTAYRRVLALMQGEPALASSLSAACAVTAAEVVYAAREEMAVRLSDTLLRRTEAGSAAHPGAEAVRRAAALMAREQGWDASRTAAEIQEVEARYAWPDRRD